MTRIGDFTTADGFGKRNDESDEVLAGLGALKSANIVGGLDTFDRDLKLVRWRSYGDVLGLWNRRKDDCTL